MVYFDQRVWVGIVRSDLFERDVSGNESGIVEMSNPSILAQLQNQITLILINVLDDQSPVLKL